MPSVDSRVVRMEFDNAQFERGVSATIASIAKLNESLKFKNAGAGLADISAAAGKVNLNPISEGIEGVSKKFLALSTIAITALSRIVNAAISTGVALTKNLALGNVLDGFHEYETNIKSIQTILSNTRADGTNLQQVNAALDELNQFADKTIFNFAEMTRNIGTFTAAGVDLTTSVQSIKGIANLAAISGSSSEQAATAMYQLSQAIASGTVKLMDWNSVVNAGMGGEVFQTALFESGKALKTLTDVPAGQTFEEWKNAGNSFRDSLQDGWITGEVLTTTLQGIAGEMSETELIAKGFSAESAKALVELGKVGLDAATKVRTFSGLMDTTKEAIGSGWAASFRILIGNFDEATLLFTNLSNVISGFVNRSSDQRNKFLQAWADLGGRMLAIEAIRLAFKRLGEILKPLADAFRKVFPPVTAQRIVDIQWAIVNFLNGVKPSEAIIKAIGAAFETFFNILKIGWNVLKEGVKFVAGLVASLLGLVNVSDISGGLSNIANFFSNLAKSLVDGNGIKQFFSDLTASIKDLPALLQGFKDKIVGLFDGVDPKVPDAVAESMGRFSDRFQTLKDALGKVGDLWGPFSRAIQKIFDILENVWVGVRDWFKTLGQKIADNMGEGDFNAVLDAINVGLLAAIAALLAKFFKDGFKFDLTGGAFGKLKSMFEELTGVFSAMQTKLKSEALLKIATAIGILTASVLVLSLIDSAALSKALAAMSVGFAQLMAAFAILSKITLGPSSAASFTILAGGMIVLSTAILILAGAAKVLGSMSWNELAKGLTGVTVLLGALSIAAKPLAANSAGMLSAGLAMIPLAIALVILSKAVQIFANMSWEEIVRGLIGMTAGIVGLGLAMRTFPNNMAATGVGLLLVSLSLDKIAGAVQTFADMKAGDIAKGIISMSLALAGIGLAMQTMPANMPLTAAGLLLVSIALKGIQLAVKAFAGMSWGEIVKGLVGMAGALLVLGPALTLMSGSVGGAIALGIAAVSLGVLVKVLKEFAKIKVADLVRGLVAMAASLAVIAGAALLLAPAIPLMIGLGAALILIGAGFALFGVGAAAVAKAFELFAKVGPKGAEAFLQAMETIAKAIPRFIAAVAEGLVEAIVVLGKMAGPLAEALGQIIGAVIDQLVLLVPKLGELLGTLITTLINLLREKIPEYVLLGVDIIMALLQGIRDRIGEIVTVVGEIITNFLDALAVQLPLIVQSVADLWIAMITSAAEAIGRVGATLMFGVGINLIKGFIDGLTDQLGKVWDWIKEFVTGIIDRVKSALGINSPSTVFKAIGVDLITGFLNGIVEAAVAVFNWFKNLAKTIISNVGDMTRTLWDKGYAVVSGFFTGLTERWVGVANWFGGLGGKIVDAVGSIGSALFNVGKSVIQGLWDGMQNVWDKAKGWLGNLNPASWFNDINPYKGHAAKNLIPTGEAVMGGLWNGMASVWGQTTKWLESLDPADHLDTGSVVSNFQTVVDSAALVVSDMGKVEPVITPVLDLSQIEAGMQQIQAMFGQQPVGLGSLNAARQISLGTIQRPVEDPNAPVPTGSVVYNQTVNAPKQLSTSDIYRQTRNLIAVRKEDLAIP